MLIADMFSSSRKRIDERVSEQQRKLVREQVSKSRLFKEWKAGGASSGEEFNPNFQQKLELYLEQSGLRLTIADVCRRSVLFATVAGVLPALYCHYSITFGAMLAGAVIPWVHVVVAHRKRMRKLSEQLPEVFDFMRRSVQAGQTIQNALQIVAKQTSSPVSDELTYCCEQQNLGLPYELTLRDMAQRTGVVEF
ncbi:hypothetical protein KOR42_54780 [Thalassoglobus neptunius]|uniref:Bacterial type II secretion system protein F domain protein n=2 Tax=Thalassoglobus neptunius TaxID=1938619 RepID=A0A5C5UX41_9PLAN|nr:hypothetical protein KOR42_54780 [Thalassoglobus neptunius]